LFGKPGRKRPIGRPKRKYDKIGTDPREILWEGVDWMHLAQNRDQWQAVVNTVINLPVP
jgi:hypothetical protein